MKAKIKGVLLLALSLFVFSGCTGEIANARTSPIEIEDFTMTNQHGEKFGLSDLKGKVWIADFIFTNCNTVCPPMTANMMKLQNMIKDEGLDIEIVSFNVDPEVDTPEMLKAYLENYSADQTKWHALTGYSQKFINEFAMKNFKSLVDKPKKGDQVIHMTQFYLVDKNGEFIKEYAGLENPPYEEMIKDMKVLVKK
ncbi:SCO family protein [Priestia taiwanensis]|uniref:Lipoprotein n=1 Tax=Priestia taiwanensis TaxID=1347902 RepID=A0A917AN03_9BACI|nr:SCO family protein [Priestia taiwanensis]MBM7362083.1 protein SCO1/2 [Priestia taiwanensis]GGE59321.1 lipoprotein [Priestia taiwanensis]